MTPCDALEALSRRINRTVEVVLFILAFSMAVIVGLQVFFRYVLNASLFWSEELARYLLIWLTFLGATVAYRRKAHPGIDAFYLRMPENLQRAAVWMGRAAAAGFFGVMIVYGCRFAHFVRFQISPALYLPQWIVFSVIPASGAILLLHEIACWAGPSDQGGHP